MGLHLTTPSAAALGLSILLGWLAGGLANWAADVLPGRGPGKAGGGAASDPKVPDHTDARPPRTDRRAALPHPAVVPIPSRRLSALRGATSPPAPLLEAATIVAFALAWL